MERRVARKFTVWSLIERPTPDRWEFYIEHYLRDIRLLDAGDLQRLFPGAKTVHERLGGLTKSLIAVQTLRDRTGGSAPMPSPEGK